MWLSQHATSKLPILKDALEDWGALPARDPRQFARQEKRQQEALDFTIDGTERRRPRPKNPAKQALPYRGKKRTPSDKNLVIANTQTKRVGYWSQTYAGKIHDKKIADVEPSVYPRGTTLRKNTGFQGDEPRGCQTYQPKKSRAKAN